MPFALVTGAGVRVGAAIASSLADAGFDLILHAHSSVESLKSVAKACEAKGRRVLLVTADLSQPPAIDTLEKAVQDTGGTLDVLVNNAAIFKMMPFPDITREAYQRTQAINVEAPFFLTQRLLPALRRGHNPCVVNLVDIAAERAMAGYGAHYTVSKAGLLLLTRALAVELAPHIRVNGVSPGVAAFPDGFSEAQRQQHLARVPMAKEGTVEDIASAVVYLAQHATYVTGQILAVDGGWSAQL